MSSIIFNDKLPNGSTDYDRCFTVNKKQPDNKEDLADYVRRVREGKRMSLTDVEKQSERAGNKIAGSYVSRIENRHQRPEGISSDKLDALAKGLGVPPEEVFAVARGESPKESPDYLKNRLGRLALRFGEISKGAPIDKRVRVETLIDLLEQELDRMNGT
ncbi:MAG TPA: helix-turn-helix transcriptional regulator [Pyrinomonadaceae bacterium]